MTQRYPAYRASGVEWLGNVPEGWPVIPSRRLFAQVRKPAMEDDEQLSATQKSGVLPQRLYMEQEDQKVVLALAGLENFKHVEAGDFVISLRSFQGGIEYSAYRGCVSPAYTVLRPRKDMDQTFFKYLLKDDDFISKLQSVTTGIRDGRNVSYEQFGVVLLPLPPLPEQIAIAAFLDRETAKIDALVEEQKRLIELLKEKRQAVISHAVTKGLNPDAILRPSGIDWLGDVPEGWEVMQLRRLIKEFEQGYSPECFAYPAALGEWGVLKSGCVNRGRYREEENKTLPPDVEPRLQWEVAAGDLLMSRASGSPELIGSVAIVDATQGRILMSDKIFRLRLESIIRTDFAYWLFASDGLRAQIVNAISGGDGMANNLPQSSIKEFKTVLPSLREQEEIAALLKVQCLELDALTAAAEAAITLLKERRAAIISATVTGKIDVRDIAAKQEAA
jgi:type I restriction enzyme, S subunit